MALSFPEPSEWPAAYARVQRLSDRDVIKLLQEATREINAMIRRLQASGMGISNSVRINQLQQIKRFMINQQALVFEGLGDIIRSRRLQAVAAASDLGSDIDDVLFRFAGRTEQAQALRGSLAATAEQTVEAMVARVTLTQIPLAQRIYNTNVWMDGRVQNMINSAIARGLSAREFAKEAVNWFRPDTPGGVRYAAMRLARTELNNAFHGTSIMQANEKPWINQMQWHLSSSHPKPDDCDKIAKGGRDGDGIYPPRDVPRKPHPHCFCYVVPVPPDEDEFLDNLVKGKYNDYLDAKMDTRFF